MKISAIKALVSQSTGVSIKAMEQTGKTGGLRTPRVAVARWLVVWLARKQGMTYGEIALHGHVGSIQQAQGAMKSIARSMENDWDLVDHAGRLLEQVRGVSRMAAE